MAAWGHARASSAPLQPVQCETLRHATPERLDERLLALLHCLVEGEIEPVSKDLLLAGDGARVVAGGPAHPGAGAVPQLGWLDHPGHPPPPPPPPRLCSPPPH